MLFRRAFGALVILATLSAAADDGMWMPQQVPAVGEELKKLGLQIDQSQFADLTAFPLGAIVAINGWNRLSVAFQTEVGSYKPLVKAS